jgi:predicted ATPase with chaperone activity
MSDNSNAAQDTVNPIESMRFRKVAPRPKCVEDTGLSREFLADLTAKHLQAQGTLSLAALANALCLSGAIVEHVLNFMRGEARIEVRPGRAENAGLNYALTERGRNGALDALLRSGYVGPAPVPVKQYARVARAQSVHKQSVSRASMNRAFHDIVLDQDLVDRLGASMNSGRAIFLYGSAGTGKTYVSQRLTRLFPDPVLIPYAIAIGENVIQLFDPLVHKIIDDASTNGDYQLDRGHDPRFQVCERPAVVTAGELSAEMLEVMYEPSTKTYEAPLQLKANNGVFIIDDLGRQRIEPSVLFNRWIVPLEEKRDYLNLHSGRHFSVPFDVVYLFHKHSSAGAGRRGLFAPHWLQDRVHSADHRGIRANLARYMPGIRDRLRPGCIEICNQ